MPLGHVQGGSQGSAHQAPTGAAHLPKEKVTNIRKEWGDTVSNDDKFHTLRRKTSIFLRTKFIAAGKQASYVYRSKSRLIFCVHTPFPATSPSYRKCPCLHLHRRIAWR